MTESIDKNLHKAEIAVRYAETDAMGFVYYGNYFTFFEVARISALAKIGYPYHIMEKNNILIPVLSAHADYKKPAKFGDVLEVRTKRFRLGQAKIHFTYEVYRGTDLIATGETTHAFMNSDGKPIRPPKDIFDLFPPLKD
jgi:acyl-CoA thioester hydrolase